MSYHLSRKEVEGVTLVETAEAKVKNALASYTEATSYIYDDSEKGKSIIF